MDFISYIDTVLVCYSVISKNYTVKANLRIRFFHVRVFSGL